MSLSKTCIYNANIILPNEVVFGFISIDGNSIINISSEILNFQGNYPDINMINAQGAYVMPGIIDIHSDAIEKEIQPRPNALFPIDMAFYELEKRLAGNGITTIYHSLCLSDEWGVRDSEMVIDIIRNINKLKNIRTMINHKIHLRYELTYLDGLKKLEELIHNNSIDFMSYMDHTPGQGQFRSLEDLKNFTMQSYGKKEKDVNEFIDKTIDCQSKIDWNNLIRVARIAKTKGIRLAFHDDDTKEKIETLLKCEGVLSEFPINIETALYAKSKDLHVCVGAPNIVRGMSHSKNMRAIDAIHNNAADIVCSDYLPSAMLPAVFNLAKEEISLSEAVKMVTSNPAKALGIDSKVGSIEKGKQADLLIVELHKGYPVVRKTIACGKVVYQADFNTFGMEGAKNVC